jgi:hypothetical protein
MLADEAARRFPHLLIPADLHTNPILAREPFESSIRERIFALLGYLDAYMAGRGHNGSEGPEARRIIRNFFTGERALFSGESETNQVAFRKELTFKDPDDDRRTVFAHWHAKIRHRQFRIHFEWPVPTSAPKLKIVYLGPKITKE